MSNKRFNSEKFKEILSKNKSALVDSVFTEAVYLALRAKHGARKGLLCVNEDPISHQAIKEMYDSMAPLVRILQYEATACFARVFEGILEDKMCRDYLHQKTAAAIGRKGGRPSGKREPYLIWLESAMRTNEEIYSDAIPPLSAKEHFRELCRERNELDGEDDDGNLIFSSSHLKKMGYTEEKKEPVITLNAVTKILTLIRKKQ